MLKGRGNAPTSSARSTAGPTTSRASCSARRISPTTRASTSAARRSQNWNGLLFDGKRDVARDLAALGVHDFDFSDHVLDRIEIHECNYNWKTFIEVYLEDYHVEPFHPGLGQFVTCDDLKWEFGDWYSVQTVGVNNGLAKPGHDDLRALAQGGARLLPRRDAAARRDLDDRTTRTSCSSGIRTCWSSAR